MHCHQFAKEKRNEQAPLDSADSTVLKCVYTHTHIFITYQSLLLPSFSKCYLISKVVGQKERNLKKRELIVERICISFTVSWFLIHLSFLDEFTQQIFTAYFCAFPLFIPQIIGLFNLIFIQHHHSFTRHSTEHLMQMMCFRILQVEKLRIKELLKLDRFYAYRK